MKPTKELAYITGIAIGDGNISNPNKKAYRLRITCDKKYPKIIERIIESLKILFPRNKVSVVERKDNALDISVYNNSINNLFGWRLENGKKIDQIIQIPEWINKENLFIKNFIKGLFESDGSIYIDRKYLNANLVSYNREIVDFAFDKIIECGFSPKKYTVKEKNKNKYTVKVSTKTQEFLSFFDIKKEAAKQKIIVVLGPTATGKSDLAVQIAKDFNGEIISADSRQVYKGLDIGSGKITKEEMKGIPHYLLDVASPKRVFTVAQFKKIAEKAILGIREKGEGISEKIPIICGGTGFYIDALIYDMNFPEVKADIKLRKELEKKSLEELQKILKKLDKERFKEIDQKNKVRLVRAIEIAKSLGKVPKLSEKGKGKSVPSDNEIILRGDKYDVLWIGIDFEDKVIKDRVYKRILKRMDGMKKEVKKLRKNNLSLKRMKKLGLEYRNLALLHEKKINEQEFIDQLFLDISHFVKRQRTWFSRNPEKLGLGASRNINWFIPPKYPQIKKLVKEFLKK